MKQTQKRNLCASMGAVATQWWSHSAVRLKDSKEAIGAPSGMETECEEKRVTNGTSAGPVERPRRKKASRGAAN